MPTPVMCQHGSVLCIACVRGAANAQAELATLRTRLAAAEAERDAAREEAEWAKEHGQKEADNMAVHLDIVRIERDAPIKRAEAAERQLDDWRRRWEGLCMENRADLDKALVLLREEWRTFVEDGTTPEQMMAIWAENGVRAGDLYRLGAYLALHPESKPRE